MFEKSRKKIIMSIMSILVAVWVGTLGIIFALSYMEMSRQNEQMLRAHAEMYIPTQMVDDLPGERPVPNGGGPGLKPGFTDTPVFQLTTFYTVAVSGDGNVMEIRNDRPAVYTDDELERLAKVIIESEREFGSEKNLSFYCADKGGYRLVVFMDNTVVNERAFSLLRYTFILGGAALIVFFFLSKFLAKKIVQPLEESYKKQKQFISDAGHELKTPISVVSANAELLLRETGNNQWLANIQYENERMGILVSQLLDLARTENVSHQMEPVDFSRLVSGEALPFESVAFEKGLVLNVKVEKGIMVIGNEAQLKQVISVLLDNAIRYSNEKGAVCIKLFKEQGWAKLSVINSGDAIPEEQKALLFERFYRVDRVRNSEDGHYGLGLAIAKSVAAAHKGHIMVSCYDGLVEFQFQISYM